MSSLASDNSVVIRLHLVRHAETNANLLHNVIGQSDSSLTDHGIMQALSLSAYYQSRWFSSVSEPPSYFWRIYSSDLQRTKHTTQILLSKADTVRLKEFSTKGQNDFCATVYDPNDAIGVQVGVRYDSRLREIARGLNQGLPKHFTAEQAMEIFTSGQHPLYNCHDAELSWPVSESHDDVWDRVYSSWLMEVVQDIASLFQNGITTKDQNRCSFNRINVLAITHGALLRLFLKRLIGEERLRECSDASFKTVDNSSGPELRLDIPNTSVTVVDIHVNVATCEIARTEMVQLTSTAHFEILSPTSTIA